jgi:Zn-dependent protease with chaperone function
MKQILKPLFYLLIVPIFFLVVYILTSKHFDNEDLLILNFIKSTSIIISLIILVYFTSILILSKIAINKMQILHLFFKPLFYLTSFLLIVFILVNGILACSTIYYAEMSLFNTAHGGILFVIIIGVFIGIVSIIKSIFLSFKKTPEKVKGTLLKSDNEIVKYINSIAKEYHVPTIDNIIIGKSPSFFVTESKLEYNKKTLKGKSMYLSSLICNLISIKEFKALIIHELAHFKGKDTKYSMKFYPIYRGCYHGIDDLDNKMDGIKSIAIVPAYYLYLFFLESFTKAESKLSRKRELIADKEAIKMTSPLIFATSLLKISAISSLWTYANDKALDETYFENNSITETKALLYFNKILPIINTKNYMNLLNYRVSHPFDTHPTTFERIKNSGINISEVLENIGNIKFENNFKLPDELSV